MITAEIVIRTLSLLVFALLCGVAEAYYFRARNYLPSGVRPAWGEHELLTAIRVTVWVGAFISGLITLGVILIFPFLHDGAYYETRKRLSKGAIYPRGFWTDKSKTDTAKISLYQWQRVALALLGLADICLVLAFPECDLWSWLK